MARSNTAIQKVRVNDSFKTPAHILELTKPRVSDSSLDQSCLVMVRVLYSNTYEVRSAKNPKAQRQSEVVC